MINKKNIMLLIPNLLGGGSERFVSTLSLKMVNDYNVYIVVFDSSVIKYKYGGTIIDLKLPAKKNFFRKACNVIKRIRKVNKITKQYSINYICSFNRAGNLVNIFTFNKAKKVVSCRGYFDLLEKGDFFAKNMRRFNAIIFNSLEMKQHFTSRYSVNENKVFSLYNIINYKLINKLSNEAFNNDFLLNHKVICTCSRFAFEKGHWHLIKSFDIIKGKIPDVKLLLIGEGGELQSEIKNMISQLPYASDIIFLGFTENPFKYISKCDVFVMTSIYEGFPNALVEALMCNIPVISSSCKTGPKEILSNQYISDDITSIVYSDYGILTPEFSKNICFNINNKERQHSLFAEAVIEVLTNSAVQNKYINLGKKISKRFEQQEIYNQFIEIINMI